MQEEIFPFNSAFYEIDIKSSLSEADNLFPKVNIVIVIFLILIGFVGNFLVIGVFSRKRFRSNPSQVLILFTAIIDNLFLVVHFFEVNFFLVLSV
jgi:hypothetical protein